MDKFQLIQYCVGYVHNVSSAVQLNKGGFIRLAFGALSLMAHCFKSENRANREELTELKC